MIERGLVNSQLQDATEGDDGLEAARRQRYILLYQPEELTAKHNLLIEGMEHLGDREIQRYMQGATASTIRLSLRK